MFASTGAGVIRGYDAVGATTEAAGLEKPERIRSSNMRKYIATMTQSFDISPQQMEWVCDHLGHSMDVHRAHYRATSDIIERVHVAKILVIQDMGLVGKYHGRALRDIPLEELVIGVSGETEVTEAVHIQQTENDTECLDFEEYIPNLSEDEGAEGAEEFVDFTEPKPKSDCKKRLVNRHHWTASEEEELKIIFKKYFESRSTPGQASIIKGKEISAKKNGLIHMLKRDNIKKKINNMLKKLM
ncbi:PREDICTED: uncharacterized protein LOC106810847 [Priapulus caudatus]|uniref:Uncharacterized protein LOC106810847 n=1 Tax=Priapulus caudatus TaxID=37621 RepID=A0ABM1EC79_PRICU|nr:PREDICTED: uncharacterized protein LOC106810847 [Priapulus caudatus]